MDDLGVPRSFGNLRAHPCTIEDTTFSWGHLPILWLDHAKSPKFLRANSSLMIGTELINIHIQNISKLSFYEVPQVITNKTWVWSHNDLKPQPKARHLRSQQRGGHAKISQGWKLNLSLEVPTRHFHHDKLPELSKIVAIFLLTMSKHLFTTSIHYVWNSIRSSNWLPVAFFGTGRLENLPEIVRYFVPSKPNLHS